MATRNTLTYVRPMISGPLAFCESTTYLCEFHFACFFLRKFGESLAKAWRKKAFP